MVVTTTLEYVQPTAIASVCVGDSQSTAARKYVKELKVNDRIMITNAAVSVGADRRRLISTTHCELFATSVTLLVPFTALVPKQNMKLKGELGNENQEAGWERTNFARKSRKTRKCNVWYKKY